jgi:hypothetical protein
MPTSRDSGYIVAGGSTPHGAMQAIWLAQSAAVQWPFKTGTQAEPAGKPNAWQSVSRLQVLQAL